MNNRKAVESSGGFKVVQQSCNGPAPLNASARIAILLFPNTPVIAMRAASEWAPCRREGPAGRTDLITQTQKPPAIEELLPPPPASIQKKDAKARNPGKGGVTSPAVFLPSPHFPAHQASSSNPATGPQVRPPHPGPQFGGLGAISWKREMCSSACVSCRHGLRFLFFSFSFQWMSRDGPAVGECVVRDSGDGCYRCQSQSSLWNQKSYVLV